MYRTRLSTVRRQRGAYAAALAVLMVALLGFIGIAVDAGRLFIAKTELQNASDACALAAAAALGNGGVNRLDIAEAYGITAGTRNLIAMQSRAAEFAADSSVTFSIAYNGPYHSKTAISAANIPHIRFVQCSAAEAGINPLLVQVLNAIPGVTIGNQTAGAAAVASLAPSISNCALPVKICSTNDADANFGRTVGEWIAVKLDPGECKNGDCGWITYPPDDVQLKDLMALLKGSGRCNLDQTTQVQVATAPGEKQKLADGWNSRFGVYSPKIPGDPFDVSEGIPDLTGFAYGPGMPGKVFTSNAYADFLDKRAHTIHIQPEMVPTTGSYKASEVDDWYRTHGSDRRVVVVPVLKKTDCENSAAKKKDQVNPLNWACVLMLNPFEPNNKEASVEYLGRTDDLSAGCVSSGMPGGPSAHGPKVPALVQ